MVRKIILIGIVMSVSGCMVYEETPIPDKRTKVIATTGNAAANIPTKSRQCDTSSFINPDFTPSDIIDACQYRRCQAVPINVQYLLAKDLGHGYNAVIEAFDNPRFFGSPVAQTNLLDFNPTHPGQTKTTFMTLTPGSYYLRARLDNDNQNLPYEYKDMILVGNDPVGFYGALSSPKKIYVGPDRLGTCRSLINIGIDKLFVDPSKEPKSQAKLRLKLEVASTSGINPGGLTYIELHHSRDFAKTPSYRYSISSEQFLISDHYKEAEFVTPSVNPGYYYIFAYMDTNSNGYYDEGEAQAIHSQNQSSIPVSLEKNRTETMNLRLTALGGM